MAPGTNASSRALQSLTGRSHVLFPGRASAGIYAVLHAYGLKDRWVLIPANGCYIVGWAVLSSGNRPFLVDVDPATGNISPETLDRVALDDVAALIACHMYGLAAPMGEIQRWARDHHVFLIEDAALALGAHADGRPVGAWGDVSVFSFGSGKIADVGNGGALLADDPALAAEIDHELSLLPEWTPRLDELQDQWLQVYWALHQFETANPRLLAMYPLLFDTFGEITTYRLPGFPDADLVAALDALPDNLAHRRMIAGLYQTMLAGFPSIHSLHEPPGSIIWRYPLLVDRAQRDGLLRHLWAEGFHEVTRWYPSLRYMLSQLTSGPCFDQTPGADTLSAQIINLPVDLDMDADTAMNLSAVVADYFEGAL